jgi:FkbM family methyltransferase
MGQLKAQIKTLARSRSLGFTRDHFAPPATESLAAYQWRDVPLTYRRGTSDTGLIYNILLKAGQKSEYCPPPEFRREYSTVRTVLDIGANIGISAVYFSRIFPNADVHAFEPAPRNVAVLARNAAAAGRIHCHAFALGDQDGELSLFDSDDPMNQGGYSFFEAGTNQQVQTRAPIRKTDNALAALAIQTVDVIKIDTEGAEWEILTTMDPAMLRGVSLIMGELHGRRDFALLDYLQPHFHIGMRKGIEKRLFNFYAIRRDD